MKILVTGGAGFIGSNIIEKLIINKYDVCVLDNFSTGKRENLTEFGENISLIEGDIRSYHIVKRAVKDVDVILHLAALPSVPRSISDPITSNEVNVTGTLNILQAAIEEGVKRVVLSSSSSVYGDNVVSPKKEDLITLPKSPYAVSKLACENYCRVFSQIYGLHTVILRYFNVFGPRQDPNSQYSAVIPKFINKIRNNESPVIYGDGTQSRDFTFVENVVNANLLAIDAKCEPGMVFNCACGETNDLNKLVNEINVILGKSVTPEYIGGNAGDIKHSLADISLANSVLKYKPLYTFSEGLKKTVEWHLRTMVNRK